MTLADPGGLGPKRSGGCSDGPGPSGGRPVHPWALRTWVGLATSTPRGRRVQLELCLDSPGPGREGLSLSCPQGGAGLGGEGLGGGPTLGGKRRQGGFWRCGGQGVDGLCPAVLISASWQMVICGEPQGSRLRRR